MAKLKILAPFKEPFIFHLVLDETSIGRSSDSDITISDPLLSRKHSTIFRRDNEYFVKDNESKNGTYLNNNRVTEERPLKHNDVIKIGQTTLQFLAEVEERREKKRDKEGSFDTSSTQMFAIKNLLKDYESDIKAAPERAESSTLLWQNKALITLKDFSMELLTHMHLKDMLENIMDFAGKTISARRGILMLKEGDADELATKVTRYYKGQKSSKPIKISRTIVNSVLENKASLLTSDAQLDKRFSSKESIIAESIHSAICLPLWNNKEVIGLIYMDRGVAEQPFSKDELYLMSSLANMAAIKIENTRLFEEALEKRALEEQLSLAAEIQKSLLPRQCPEIEGLDIAAFHIPCSYVGGDYYDFFCLPEGQIGFAVGDVAGKGAAAALLMATLRAALASQIKLKISLIELFHYLNNFIYESSASNKFITFCYGQIQTEKGSLQFINAGHNPPLILSKNKKVVELPAGGLSLGFFPDCAYEMGEAQLKAGDILILFTDGITERANEKGEEFKEEKLMKLIEKNKKLSAQEMLDKALDTIEEFACQEAQQDDMTLVIIKKL